MSAASDGRLRRAVSPLELFFDLVFVFVFAVGQLAEHLHAELSWRGAAETVVMLIAVLGTWVLTSFDATFLDITRARTRGLVLAVMGLGLFHERPDPARVRGSAVGVRGAAGGDPAADRHDGRRDGVGGRTAQPLPPGVAVGRGLGSALAGGGGGESGAAAGLVGRGAAVDLAGTWLRHPLPGRTFPSRHFVFDAGHMVERIRLFLMLQLGETVLTIGSTISDAPVDAPTVAAAFGVFAALVCLWATYFSGGEQIVTRQVATTADPMRSIHRAVNGRFGTLTGLVALAVGAELVISHSTGPGSVLLFGGPILYLTAQAWWYYVTTGRAWAPRLLACGAASWPGWRRGGCHRWSRY